MNRVSALLSVGERLRARAPKGLFRFLSIGMVGLASHTVVFTVLHRGGSPKSLAWFVGLVIATTVTWRLNRRFTFTSAGRRRGSEAVRYALVTVVAQGVSYGVFKSIGVFDPRFPPAVALIVGAVVATVFSYSGHRFLTFAPHKETAAKSVVQEVPVV